MDKLKQLSKEGNTADILKELKQGRLLKSQITTFYKMRKLMPEDTAKEIYNILIKPNLSIMKTDTNTRIKKDKKVHSKIIKKIFEMKNSEDPKDLFLYILLNTGRRIKEVNDMEFKIKDNTLMMKLAKKKKLEYYPIKLIENNPKETEEILKIIRSNNLNSNSLPTLLKRKLRFFELNPHDLRGLYISIIHKYINPENDSIASLAGKLLNNSGSGRFYGNIEIVGADPFKNYNKMTVEQLKAIAKKLGKKKYSKLRKAQLIELIEE